MTNPFESEGDKFLVLANDEDQLSIWPVQIDIPKGWRNVFGPNGRQTCLDYVDAEWTDMRPKRLKDIAAKHHH